MVKIGHVIRNYYKTLYMGDNIIGEIMKIFLGTNFTQLRTVHKPRGQSRWRGFGLEIYHVVCGQHCWENF